jgi:hypothetical protein
MPAITFYYLVVAQLWANSGIATLTYVPNTEWEQFKTDYTVLMVLNDHIPADHFKPKED